MPDPRTDPQNYGPGSLDGVQGPNYVRQPLTDDVAGLKDALSGLDPEMRYFINSVGMSSRKRTGADMLIDRAYQGQTADEMEGEVQAAEAAEQALSLAQESLGLSEQDFQGALAELEGEQMPAIPERGQVQQPGRLEQGLAALLSIGTPEHAFDIGSVPHQNEQRKVEEAYQQDAQVYGQEMAKRSERIRMKELRLKYADENRQKMADRAYKAMEEAGKAGRSKEAAGLKARAEVYDSKSPEEIDDRILAMRESGMGAYIPVKSTIDGLKATLKAAKEHEKEKLALDKDKEEATRINGVVDDFARWVDDFRPADREITAEDVKAIKAEASKWAKDNNVPLHRLAVPGARPLGPGQVFQQQRYADELPARDLDMQINRKRLEKLEGDIEKEKSAPPKDKLDKQKKVAAAGEASKMARARTDAHLKSKPTGLGVFAGNTGPWIEKLHELIQSEYEAVAKKRFIASGAYPAFADYMKEQAARFGLSQPDAPRKKGEVRPAAAAPPPGFKIK